MKMRSRIVIAALIGSLFVLSAYAGDYTYGGKLGVGISTLYGSDAGGTTLKMGLNIYGFFEKQVNNLLAWHFELGAVRKGANNIVPPPAPNADKSYLGLTYLDIPILAKLCIPVSASIKPALYAGPSLGFILSTTMDDGTTSDDAESIQNFDFGLSFGGEIGFPVEMLGGDVLLDLRYTFGLSNVAASYHYTIRNSNFSILLGYAFKLP
jgi:hypothetical protein